MGGVEVWVIVPNTNNEYMVSNMGRVKSVDRIVEVRLKGHTTSRPVKGRVLKDCDNGNGYRYVNLKRYGTRYVHRLVMLAFYGDSSKVVNHKDLNKSNNSLENLEYVTQKENIRHSIQNGNHFIGERHPMAKLSNEQHKEIKNLILKGIRQRKIAEMFGISRGYVSEIKTGRKTKDII